MAKASTQSSKKKSKTKAKPKAQAKPQSKAKSARPSTSQRKAAKKRAPSRARTAESRGRTQRKEARKEAKPRTQRAAARTQAKARKSARRVSTQTAAAGAEREGVIGKSVRALSGLLSSLSSPYFGEIAGTVQYDRLMPVLGEFLVHERQALEHYSRALDHSSDEEVRDRIGIFLAQNQKHTELIESAIRNLGGKPEEQSQGARYEHERSQAVLGIQVPSNLQEIYDLENLVLSETHCQLNWELLSEMLPFIEDQHTHDVVQRMVDEVEDEKDDHVNWARRTYALLRLRQLVSGEPSIREEEEFPGGEEAA